MSNRTSPSGESGYQEWPGCEQHILHPAVTSRRSADSGEYLGSLSRMKRCRRTLRREGRGVPHTIVAPGLQKKKDFFVASSIGLSLTPNFYDTCGSFLKCVLLFFHIFEQTQRIIVI